jgi:hypothetical protein
MPTHDNAVLFIYNSGGQPHGMERGRIEGGGASPDDRAARMSYFALAAQHFGQGPRLSSEVARQLNVTQPGELQGRVTSQVWRSRAADPDPNVLAEIERSAPTPKPQQPLRCSIGIMLPLE